MDASDLIRSLEKLAKSGKKDKKVPLLLLQDHPIIKAADDELNQHRKLRDEKIEELKAWDKVEAKRIWGQIETEVKALGLTDSTYFEIENGVLFEHIHDDDED